MDRSKISYHSLKSSESADTPESLSSSSEPDLEDATPFPGSKPPYRLLSLLSRLVVVIFAIWGFLSVLATITQHLRAQDVDVYRPATLPAAYNHCACGSTVAEARARGCKYDSMGAAWLPEYCRDDELTAAFARAGTEPDGAWPYFADANGTRRVSVEGIAEMGRGSFYATRYWHVAHCLFYWEKYVRMRDTGKVMEARFDRAKHTQHCRKLALKRGADPDLLIAVEVVMDSKVDDLGHEEHH